MKTAVFLERDGVLNPCEVRGGVQQVPLRLEQFRVREEVRPHLESLKRAGFLLIVATHQPGLSQGKVGRNEIELMHRILRHKLPVDDIFLCGSDDPTHPCYKPQPGMFTEAAFKWGLDLDRCFVISDKWTDAKSAQVVGMTSVLIDSPWIGDDHHDFVVADFGAAVAKILGLSGQGVSTVGRILRRRSR
jgi:D-glycero-D-manno-heptose 1,7-bisphosphate phosphatase